MNFNCAVLFLNIVCCQSAKLNTDHVTFFDYILSTTSSVVVDENENEI